MSAVKELFCNRASYYENLVRDVVPGYDAIHTLLAQALPFDASQCISVLDIGSGPGETALEIKKRFPGASIVCMDISPQMHEIARKNLAEFDGISFVQADLNEMDGERLYDCVCSSLVLHHLKESQEKREIYKRILRALKPGGLFLNADIVLGSHKRVDSFYRERWGEFMHTNGVAKDYIIREVTYSDGDYPAPLVDQLSWLTDLGYEHVDVLWKQFNFAVFGGFRPCFPVY